MERKVSDLFLLTYLEKKIKEIILLRSVLWAEARLPEPCRVEAGAHKPRQVLVHTNLSVGRSGVEETCLPRARSQGVICLLILVCFETELCCVALAGLERASASQDLEL